MTTAPYWLTTSSVSQLTQISGTRRRFYADGRDEFLKSMGAFLGCELPLSLAGSTDFQSNVLWPPHLAGKPLFRFIPKRPKAWLCRLLGLSSNIQCFTDEVLSELKSQGQADR
jgi:hypothetical protein